jgi:hypothetical protein
MQQPGFLQAMPNVMMSHHHMYNNRVGLWSTVEKYINSKLNCCRGQDPEDG